MENLLFFTYYGLLLMFGIVLSFAFAGIAASKKNILTGCCLFALCGIVQIILFTCLDEMTVWYVYPLIAHVPLILILCLLYRRNIVSALASVCSAYLCCQVPKWIGMLTLTLSGNVSADYAARIAALLFFGYVMVRFYASYISGIFSKDIVSVLIFATVPMVYYVFDYSMSIYTSFWHENNRVAAEFLPFFLCIIFFVFCTVYYKEYEQKAEALRKEQIIQITVQQQQKEIEAIRRSEKETRIMRHDMRHFLNIISAALNENDIEHAKAIIEKLSGKTEQISHQQFCANETVNHILSDYEQKCRSMFTDFRTDVDFSFSIADEITFLSILSNGLDNAINAVKDLPENRRRITLMIRNSGGKILLSIKNPFLNAPVMVDGIPVSKTPGHGYGTQSIRYLSEKAGGNCQFSVKDDMFILRVVL